MSNLYFDKNDRRDLVQSVAALTSELESRIINGTAKDDVGCRRTIADLRRAARCALICYDLETRDRDRPADPSEDCLTCGGWGAPGGCSVCGNRSMGG